MAKLGEEMKRELLAVLNKSGNYSQGTGGVEFTGVISETLPAVALSVYGEGM